MLGPLDRFLIRRPALQQNADANSEAQPGQSGEERLEEEEAHTPPPKPCSLEAFLTRSDATKDASTSLPEPEATCKPRRPNRWLPDWQSTGRAPPRLVALLENQHVASYSQQRIVHTHPGQQAILGGRGGGMAAEQAGSLQMVQFDSQGELLVTGSEEGLLTVHSAAALVSLARAAGTPPPPSQQGLSPAQPLLALDTGMGKLQAVRWNPANENVVGVASSSGRQLQLFDLQHTQGRPARVLAAPPASASALAGATAVGISDLAFFQGGGGYTVLAGGLGGQVFLWDSRTKGAPASVLQSQQASAVYAVALAPDEQVVLAGTQGGEVRMWDLRGGAGGAPRLGAGGLHHHPPLGAVSLRHSLAAVPGLLEQTGIPASAVHSMAFDPVDPRRLGFHLGCGWSGVLDLASQVVTHVHAPAHAFADEHQLAADDVTVTQLMVWSATAAPALHRQACWIAGSSRFCVPSRRDDSLMLLDFSPTTAAGCYALGSSSSGSSEGDADGDSWEVPSAAHMQLTQPAVCVAAHPAGDLLVAGGVAGCMSLLTLP